MEEDQLIKDLENRSIRELRAIVKDSKNQSPETISLAKDVLKVKLRPDSYYYFKNISKSENLLRLIQFQSILTLIALVLATTAIIEIIAYYSDSKSIQNNFTWKLFLILYLALTANHIFYRFENKKSNNFFGRVFIDFAYFILFFLIFPGYHYVIYGNLFFRDFNFASTFVSLLFLSAAYEGVNTLLKNLFQGLKWEII